MNPVLHTHLDDWLISYFWIEKIINQCEWGQKKVFIVERGWKKEVFKFFKDYSTRDILETDIYKRFEHLPGIPKIISICEYEWEVIVIEEYIEGDELGKVRQDYIWNRDKTVNLVTSICKTLTPLREENIVHRDLKLSNIIVKPNWNPIVIDFWIAKDGNAVSCTTTWFQPHSRMCASPEQILWKKERISYRSDFFSLAVIAYYLYHGKLPFADNPTNLIQKIENNSLTYEDWWEFGMFFKRNLSLNPSWRSRNVQMFLSLLNSDEDTPTDIS